MKLKSRDFAVCLVLGVTGAGAQGLDPELTMRPILDPAARPASVTDLLELPTLAAEVARQNSADGLAQANENRERGAENRERGAENRERGAENRERALSRATESRLVGLEIATEARERGADIAGAAVEIREGLVRGRGDLELPIPDHLSALPDHVPAAVGPPELPELPGRPELPSLQEAPGPVEPPAPNVGAL